MKKIINALNRKKIKTLDFFIKSNNFWGELKNLICTTTKKTNKGEGADSEPILMDLVKIFVKIRFPSKGGFSNFCIQNNILFVSRE